MPHRRPERPPPGRRVHPTYFAWIPLDGITTGECVEHYLDWIEGVGRHFSLRPLRASLGVPRGLDRDALMAGRTLEAWEHGWKVAVRTSPEQALVLFAHRDPKDGGAQFRTVARLRPSGKEGGVFLEHGTCRTFDSAPDVHLFGPPTVVRKILDLPQVRPREPELLEPPLELHDDEVEDFVTRILFSEDRRRPYVLVSPKNGVDEPLVDVDRLAEALETQAIVVELVGDRATWNLADAFERAGLAREFGHCFDGAVRVYHPNLRASRNPRDHYLWLPNRIGSFGERATERLATEIAQVIAIRTIPARFFSLVEDWDSSARRVRVQAKSQEATPAQEKKLAALQEEVDALREEREQCEREREELEAEVKELQLLLELAEQERDEALQQGVPPTAWAQSPPASTKLDLAPAQREALRFFARHKAPRSLEDAVHIVQALYGERIVFLPSALESARQAASFQKPDKAFDLMLILAEEYWHAYQRGGDAEGKKVFPGETFAPRESETVEGRKEARERRTFVFQGRPMVMWKHLKIGFKDSVSETWRLHFDTDRSTGKIVVGHCGKHLDFD